MLTKSNHAVSTHSQKSESDILFGIKYWGAATQLSPCTLHQKYAIVSDPIEVKKFKD